MANGEDFQRVERLFNIAVELPEEAREAFLLKECPDDPATRDRILRMIAGALSATHPGLDLSRDAAAGFPDEEPGTIIDRYTLKRRIGDGGMGVVFEAEQTEPVPRRVALKLIKLGMDTRQVIARFDVERRLLARMQHPNIAAFHDAGASSNGRPYFVMEYIDGVPINRFCDEQQLPVRDRLILFLQVCSAVRHAHQKGVIHRDLKPGNVQVTKADGKPLVKVIDFGIAKIVTGDEASAEATRIGQFIGTPEYMSPEQLADSDADIDTRADVYALGIILYELLTGVLPFSGPRRVQQGTPEGAQRPSARVTVPGDAAAEAAVKRNVTVKGLAQALRDDLDWIVLKALQYEPERRYSSVSELAADIQRYLDGRPVLAGPESLAYRTRKFVQRNKTVVGASAAIVLTLAVSVVLLSQFALQAEREREEALRQTGLANAVRDFLSEDLLAFADPTVDPDRQVTLREAVDRSTTTLDQRFDGKPLVEAMIRMTLGKTYQSLGEIDASETQYRRAMELRTEHLGATAADTLEATLGLAGILYDAERYMEGMAILDPALGIIDTTLAPDDPLRLKAINTLASLQDGLDEREAALASYERAVELHETVLGRHHPETLTAINNYAITLVEQGRNEEAQPLFIEVLDVRRRELGSEHPDTLLSMGSVAWGYMQLSEFGLAIELLEEATQTGERVLGNAHWWQANNLGILARAYLLNRQPEQAESAANAGALALADALGENHSIVVGLRVAQAMAMAALGRHDDARTAVEAAAQFHVANFGADDWRTLRLRFRQAWIYRIAGQCEASSELIAAIPEDTVERMRSDYETIALMKYESRCPIDI